MWIINDNFKLRKTWKWPISLQDYILSLESKTNALIARLFNIITSDEYDLSLSKLIWGQKTVLRDSIGMLNYVMIPGSLELKKKKETWLIWNDNIKIWKVEEKLRYVYIHIRIHSYIAGWHKGNLPMTESWVEHKIFNTTHKFKMFPTERENKNKKISRHLINI